MLMQALNTMIDGAKRTKRGALFDCSITQARELEALGQAIPAHPAKGRTPIAPIAKIVPTRTIKAPEVAKVHVRGGVAITGEAITAGRARPVSSSPAAHRSHKKTARK